MTPGIPVDPVAAGDAAPAAPPPSAGRLVLIGTPIGNLGDMSPRAADALASADLVACEDTRRTGRLFQHLGINAPRLMRMDEHTEMEVTPRLIEQAGSGSVIAVVSDAGMPALSDPGGRVLQAAVAAGVSVEVVPGPFAGAMAAVASGVLDPSGRFVFEGFLPRKGPQRRERLVQMVDERRATVIYESPRRVEASVAELTDLCGTHRAVALCRELTKLHEEVWRGTLGDAARHLAAHPPRGEYVIVLAGAAPLPAPSDNDIQVALAVELSKGVSRKDAAAAVAQSLGAAPNRVKRLATHSRAPK